MKWRAQVTASAEAGVRDLDPLRSKIETWSRSLVDLSGRNRLLNFRETASTLRIQSPPAHTLLDGLGRGWPFATLPDDEDEAVSRPGPIATEHGIVTQKNTQPHLDKALRHLQSKSTQVFNDYGLWTLQLGVGMVVWREEGATTDSRAPLILFPVRLVKADDGRRRLEFCDDEEPKHNPALHVKLDQLGLEWGGVRSIEPEPDNLEFILHEARRVVTRKDGWRVDSDHVVLGLFASHKEAMYQDLRDNADNVAASELIQAIGTAAGSALASDRFEFEVVPQERIDATYPPEEAPLVLDADGSQRQAVIAAMEGRSFVLDGPPGTGKSQTITNIIAALLYSGRKVLFVSEKAAALDVVLNRLDSVGLGSFVLALHSHNTTRKAVAQEIGRALIEEPVAPRLSESDIRTARETREQLGAYAAAMNEVRQPIGRSLHDVIGRVGLLEGAHDSIHLLPATLQPDALTAETLEEILDSMSAVAKYWDTVTASEFAWRDLRVQPIQALNALRKAEVSLREIKSDAEKLGGLNNSHVPFEPKDMGRLITLLALVPSRRAVPVPWLTMPVKQFSSDVVAPVEEFLNRLSSLREKVETSVNAVGERWQELPERLQPHPSSEERDLAKLQPLGVDPTNITVLRANELASSFEQVADELDSARSDLNAVAAILGMPAIAQFNHALRICDLATLATATNRPLADWLAPGGSGAAENAAVRVLAEAIANFTDRRDRVLHARSMAARMAGPGWSDLPSSLNAERPKSEQELEHLTPRGLSLENLDCGEIGSIAERFEGAAARLEAAHRHGRILAKLLQLNTPDSTAAATALVQLVRSSTSGSRALPEWLIPEKFEQVRVAGKAIIAAVNALREAEDSALEWWVPGTVDTEGFPDVVSRLEGSAGFLAALSKQVREDRKLAGTLSTGGSWHKNLLAKLPAALTWYQAHAALRASINSHSGLLGRYVEKERPDLQALTEAIGHAEQLHLHAATALADPSRRVLITSQLCDGSSPTQEIIDHTEALDKALIAWQNDLAWHVLAPSAGSLRKQSLNAAADWLQAHLAPLRQAATLMNTVRQIGGAAHDPQVPPVLEETRRALAAALQAQELSRTFESAAGADRRILLAWYDGLETRIAAVGQNPADNASDNRCAELLRKAVMSTGPSVSSDADLLLLGRYGTEDQLDTAALGEALGTTHNVLHLAGEAILDPECRSRLIAVLADDQRPSPVLLQRVERIRDFLTRWNRHLEQPELRLVRYAWLECKFDDAARWHRTHVSCFREAADYIEDVARVGALRDEPSLQEARSYVETVVRARAALQRFNKRDTADRALLGDLYAGSDTDPATVVSAMDWAREVRRANAGPLTEESALNILTLPANPRVAEHLQRWYSDAQNLRSCFGERRAQQLAATFDKSFEAARAALADLESNQVGAHQWAEYQDVLLALAKHRLAEMPASLSREGVPAEKFRVSTERGILSAWIEQQFDTDQRVRPHFGMDRDRLVERFQEADVQLATVAQAMVIHTCNSRRPRGTAGGHAAIIRKEAEKRARHMPVRMLLDQAKDVVQLVKPCFMMSPLTVSQFLPTGFRFDVVIFDEASQVLPQDAVNSIYRGDALIVAGDQKQLPPTSFFSIAEGSEEEWTEDGTDVYESILDECKASGGFRDLPLRWHYRSRHENLIAFSNHDFYNSGMITFPGAQEQGNDVGVEFFKVDGVYDQGSRRDNPIEADYIAQRVVHHFETRPLQSLGVVALSKAQADAISTAVERALEARPELHDHVDDDDRLDGFFIKNLESVQGDERDVIILSVGYGPDYTGKLRSHFGPINKEGGWRRLNVAITRARRRMEVVASFRGGQLPDSQSRGVQALKRFLQYAEYGPRTLTLRAADTEALPESPFEEDVLNVLRGFGYRVQPQVGVAGYRIDMAIRHPALPGMYAIGIECDGAMYHSSSVARDRDRLRQDVLENLGWTLHRIWGTDWYRNRKDSIARLRKAVEEACARDPLSGPQPPDAAEPGVRKRAPTEVPLAPVQALDPIGQPYVEVSHHQLADLFHKVRRSTGWDGDDISTPEAIKTAAAIALHIIGQESPVEEDRLVTRIRQGLGFGRTRSKIHAAIQAALADLVHSGEVEKFETTYSRLGHVLLEPRKPTAQVRRGVKQVPAVERRLAIRRIIADNPGVTWDEAEKSVAKFFGWSRRGPEIAGRLQIDLEHLLATGEVQQSNSGLGLDED
ncbi:DUF3320 domain-containing protein [Nocardia beijingensis]